MDGVLSDLSSFVLAAFLLSEFPSLSSSRMTGPRYSLLVDWPPTSREAVQHAVPQGPVSHYRLSFHTTYSSSFLLFTFSWAVLVEALHVRHLARRSG
jgi:hypothetical protein